MPKKKNLVFLENTYKSAIGTPIKSDDFQSLLTWLFKSSERTIEVCATAAYRDIQRNLRGIRNYADRKYYKAHIVKTITGSLNELFFSNVDFDNWHHNTCEKIIKLSEVLNQYLDNEFTYGLAQKWLNMTIKNMLVMENWDTQLNRVKRSLHVPVDSYVLEAASKFLDVKIVTKNSELTNYIAGLTKPWSRWGYIEYINFQKSIRSAVKVEGYNSPMDWEFDVWERISAEKRSKLIRNEGKKI